MADFASSRSPTEGRRALGSSQRSGASVTGTDSGSGDIDDYQYVDSAVDLQSSHLLCPICLRPAIEPVINSCGHLFCNSCLAAWGEHKACPLCRQELRFDTCCNAAHTLAAILDDLIVRCVYCNALMRRSAYVRHRGQQCSSATMLQLPSIPNTTRQQSTSPLAATAFDATCPAAEYGCKYTSVVNDDYEQHLLHCSLYQSMSALRHQSGIIRGLEQQLQVESSRLHQYREYVAELLRLVRQHNTQITCHNNTLLSVHPVGPGAPSLSGPYAAASHASSYIAPLQLPTPPTAVRDDAAITVSQQPLRPRWQTQRNCVIM